jgi:hypothetical protein
MTFGWVMALELVFFVQIWSCPDFSLKSFDILTWYLVWGYKYQVIISKDVKKRSGQRKIWTKNTSSRAIAQPNIIRPERNSSYNCSSSRYSQIPDFWLSYGSWTCIFCSNLKLSGLFFEVLWCIDLIFGMRLYLDELQFKFEFCSGWMTFGWVMAIQLIFSKDFKEKSGQLQIWTKNTSSRAIAQPNIIRPERNSSYNCNSSRYSQIPNIKSNFKLSVLFFDVLWYIDLIFGMWLYLDDLQFKFEFRSGRMTFGWVSKKSFDRNEIRT